jgi:hypothetical protein
MKLPVFAWGICLWCLLMLVPNQVFGRTTPVLPKHQEENQDCMPEVPMQMRVLQSGRQDATNLIIDEQIIHSMLPVAIPKTSSGYSFGIQMTFSSHGKQLIDVLFKRNMRKRVGFFVNNALVASFRVQKWSMATETMALNNISQKNLEKILNAWKTHTPCIGQ